jgi:hypothetical protein
MLGGLQNRSGCGGEVKNSQPQPGIEPWKPDSPARSLDAIPTELSWFKVLSAININLHTGLDWTGLRIIIIIIIIIIITIPTVIIKMRDYAVLFPLNIKLSLCLTKYCAVKISPMLN